MKKFLQKTKAFFIKLKLALLKAWEDLKTSLKHSREKVQAKEKKPNKGVNKVIKVVVIIWSVILLAYNITTCSVRRDCTANADTSADVAYYYIDGYNFYFEPPRGGTIYALFPSFLLSFERTRPSGAINTLRSFVLLEGYSSLDSSKLTSKEIFINDFSASDPYDLSYTTRLSYYILQPDFAPVYGESRNSRINLDWGVVPYPEDTIPSRFAVNPAPANSNTVIIYGRSPSNGREYKIVEIVFHVLYNGSSAMGGQDIDSPMLPYYAPCVGYDDGFDAGYIEGYDDGLRTGLDDNFSVFDSIFSAVDSFLDIELFDGFKISTLLYIGFGLLLVGFVIKVFLGG